MSHPDPFFDIDNVYDEDMVDYMCDDEYWEDDYDDSMDGDHDSAMESAGWGLDEDYGYYGDEEF
jgi:hypothetical protein